MTIYAGETVTFRTSAVQVDDAKTPVTDADVTSTEIIVVDSNGSEVVPSSPMTWDATDQKWTYAWTTTTNGTFVARLRLTGASFDTWEFQKVRIKVNPTPFTVP